MKLSDQLFNAWYAHSMLIYTQSMRPVTCILRVCSHEKRAIQNDIINSSKCIASNPLLFKNGSHVNIKLSFVLD